MMTSRERNTASALRERNGASALFAGACDALPIGLGYLAVAFSLGITARNAGLTPLAGFLSSLLTRASAGEYAVYSLMGNCAAYLEIVAVCFIANLRYLLMGAALTQKFSPDMPEWKRILSACCITDEIFGISVAYKGYLPLSYPIGATLLAGTMWGLGTALGISAGNVLPPSVVSALSVALYGMFIAIVIPPAKKDKAVLVVVVSGFLFSWMLARIPLTSGISPGVRIVILTLAIAAAAALIKPLPDEEKEESV